MSLGSHLVGVANKKERYDSNDEVERRVASFDHNVVLRKSKRVIVVYITSEYRRQNGNYIDGKQSK